MNSKHSTPSHKKNLLQLLENKENNANFPLYSPEFKLAKEQACRLGNSGPVMISNFMGQRDCQTEEDEMHHIPGGFTFSTEHGLSQQKYKKSRSMKKIQEHPHDSEDTSQNQTSYTYASNKKEIFQLVNVVNELKNEMNNMRIDFANSENTNKILRKQLEQQRYCQKENKGLNDITNLQNIRNSTDINKKCNQLSQDQIYEIVVQNSVLKQENENLKYQDDKIDGGNQEIVQGGIINQRQDDIRVKVPKLKSIYLDKQSKGKIEPKKTINLTYVMFFYIISDF